MDLAGEGQVSSGEGREPGAVWGVEFHLHFREARIFFCIRETKSAILGHLGLFEAILREGVFRVCGPVLEIRQKGKADPADYRGRCPPPV